MEESAETENGEKMGLAEAIPTFVRMLVLLRRREQRLVVFVCLFVFPSGEKKMGWCIWGQ